MLQNEPVLLTKAEAAALLRVSLKTIDRWREAGVLRSVDLGVRSVRFRRDDIEALLERRSA